MGGSDGLHFVKSICWTPESNIIVTCLLYLNKKVSITTYHYYKEENTDAVILQLQHWYIQLLIYPLF